MMWFFESGSFFFPRLDVQGESGGFELRQR